MALQLASTLLLKYSEGRFCEAEHSRWQNWPFKTRLHPHENIWANTHTDQLRTGTLFRNSHQTHAEINKHKSQTVFVCLFVRWLRHHAFISVPLETNTQNHQHVNKPDPARLWLCVCVVLGGFSMRVIQFTWRWSKADDKKQGGVERQHRDRTDRDVGYWHIYTVGVTDAVPDNSSHLWQWLAGLVLLGYGVIVWIFGPSSCAVAHKKKMNSS